MQSPLRSGHRLARTARQDCRQAVAVPGAPPINGDSAGSDLSTALARSEKLKIAIGIQLGTLVDWYDFFLSATVAAIVWPSVYFQFLSASAATEAAIFTYIVSYFTRPFGAFVFGHIGDRAGRRGTLVVTLLLSGGSILGIALTPGYASIGVYGAALIILFRMTFGLALGGEFGGAQSWISEVAGERRRGLWNSIVMTALPLGISLASFSFLTTLEVFGHAEFIAYAWRYPFLFGGAAVLVGVVARYRLSESPTFLRLKKEKGVAKSPALESLRRSWKVMLPLFAINVPGLALALIEGNGPIPIAFMGELHVLPTQIVEAQGLGALVAVIAVIGGGLAGDRFGRRLVVGVSYAIMFSLALPAFLLMRTGDLALIVLAQVLVSSSWALSTGGVGGALYAEQFPTSHRYSGAGIAFNIANVFGSVLGGLVAPAVAVLMGGYLAAYPYLALITMAATVVAGGALYFVKETSRTELK